MMVVFNVAKQVMELSMLSFDRTYLLFVQTINLALIRFLSV